MIGWGGVGWGGIGWDRVGWGRVGWDKLKGVHYRDQPQLVQYSNKNVLLCIPNLFSQVCYSEFTTRTERNGMF